MKLECSNCGNKKDFSLFRKVADWDVKLEEWNKDDEQNFDEYILCDNCIMIVDLI